MKKIKLLSVLAMSLLAFAFTSCNTGSDDNGVKPLTPTEKAYCYSLTAGSRMNKLVYPSDEHVTEVTVNDQKTKEYYDTLSVSTSIYGNGKDTIMSVNNFPVKIFARYIPESSETNDLKEALKKYEVPASFTCQVGYYATEPVTFLLYPTSTISCNLEYGGKTHKVDFYVTAPSYYTYGQYNATTKKVSAYLLMYGYKIDATDKDTNSPKQFSYTLGNSSMSATQIGFFE